MGKIESKEADNLKESNKKEQHNIQLLFPLSAFLNKGSIYERKTFINSAWETKRMTIMNEDLFCNVHEEYVDKINRMMCALCFYCNYCII